MVPRREWTGLKGTGRWKGLLPIWGLILFGSGLRAEPLGLPNASFESPATAFVNTHIDSWQKTAKPSWYDESGPFLWDQLTGIFKNTDPGRPDHIDNCDGNQAMWMFAIPEAGIFQDYDTMDWDDTVPQHDFNARFEIGRAYDLTVGLIGGGGNMLPGATVELSLYYRDADSNMARVAFITVTNSLASFSNTTHLVDFRVRVPPVKPTDAWAGQNIGIRLLSTVTTNLQGGYWDVDNIRLSIRNAVLLSPSWSNGQFQFTLKSEPGLRFQILTSTDALLPRSSWMSLGTVTNVSGAVSFTDGAASSGRRYYQAQELP